MSRLMGEEPEKVILHLYKHCQRGLWEEILFYSIKAIFNTFLRHKELCKGSEQFSLGLVWVRYLTWISQEQTHHQ